MIAQNDPSMILKKIKKTERIFENHPNLKDCGESE
jgi:hypothetical protein